MEICAAFVETFGYIFTHEVARGQVGKNVCTDIPMYMQHQSGIDKRDLFPRDQKGKDN